MPPLSYLQNSFFSSDAVYLSKIMLSARVIRMKKTVLTRISGFRGGSDSKESACNVGDLGSVSGLGR